MLFRHTFFFLLFLVGFTFPLIAQDWEQHYKQSQEWMEKGEIEKADEEAQKCLANYQQNQGAANTVYASILRLLQNTSAFLHEQMMNHIGHRAQKVTHRVYVFIQHLCACLSGSMAIWEWKKGSIAMNPATIFEFESQHFTVFGLSP